ncbi:Glycogen phosphorylase, liver form [Bos taurus] [Rhizoctonia solani]|uniref:Glycogen phosphorylase, liver form [Bos taurus] n=1 Tax=Rhizoctonia solani TaxID=456999 RepID=A0A0K6GDE3_9AGAM|nr:Glycogen phosphorylase, liver form [Bos taurus] [Rhizoctonia solani]
MEDKEQRKLIDITDEELVADGFLGDGAFASVIQTIQVVKENPALLGCKWVTWWMLELQHISMQEETSNKWTDSSEFSTHMLSMSALPPLISDFERVHYYHGISLDPPELYYRSDLESNPFPVPLPGDRWFQLPVKTAQGVFETPLNKVWNVVAPRIIALFDARDIKYSVLVPARFSSADENRDSTLGPVVIWVATHPGAISLELARDASSDILQILEEYQVEGAVVEWIEGSVEKLAGPPLMYVTHYTNPTHSVRRPFTAALGMPIAAKEREEEDASGTVSFSFHEGGDSKKVFAGANAPRQLVRLCGHRRFQRALFEIRDLVDRNLYKAVDSTEEIVRLQNEQRSTKTKRLKDQNCALDAMRDQLKMMNKNNERLQKFFHEVRSQWTDITRRTIGHVHWAPSISIVGDGSHGYTRDIGTFELEAAKFQKHFEGNIVDLGNKYARYDLNKKFFISNTTSAAEIPSNRVLRIRGVVERELLNMRDSYDDDMVPVFIVGKDGNATDLTLGRYSGLEAYVCDKSNNRSIELAIFNYDRMSGDFSAKGDSGALIWTSDGRMLAVLHSGMPRGPYNNTHVTFGTPAWWVVEQLKAQYPNADFNRTSYFPPKFNEGD